ncbi:MAG: hypothetical protein L0241_26965 [Planctomycetia bacterium]|nr:hypothetical protein [Planctomycetia bacterium]
MPIPTRLRPTIPSVEEFREYISLCKQIEDARQDEVGPLLARWNARAGRPYRQAEFRAYYGAVDIETFVGEMLLGVPPFVPDLTYAELRDVLETLQSGALSEAVESYFLDWLEVNLPDANISDLLYCPNQWFADEAMLHVELSHDQILAYAMAKSGRSVPGAPTDVPMPYPIPANS